MSAALFTSNDTHNNIYSLATGDRNFL